MMKIFPGLLFQMNLGQVKSPYVACVSQYTGATYSHCPQVLLVSAIARGSRIDHS